MNLAAADPAWVGPWFLVLFPVFWCVVLRVLAYVGGWSALARRYPVSGRKPAAGEPSFWLGGSFSRSGFPTVRCSGNLILTITSEGLYLKTLFLFRPFHPPLLLPWSGVRALEQRKQWFGSASVLVFVDDGTTIELFLPVAASNTVRIAAGARFAAIERPPPLV